MNFRKINVTTGSTTGVYDDLVNHLQQVKDGIDEKNYKLSQQKIKTKHYVLLGIGALMLISAFLYNHYTFKNKQERWKQEIQTVLRK